MNQGFTCQPETEKRFETANQRRLDNFIDLEDVRQNCSGTQALAMTVLFWTSGERWQFLLGLAFFAAARLNFTQLRERRAGFATDQLAPKWARHNRYDQQDVEQLLHGPILPLSQPIAKRLFPTSIF